MDSSSGRNSNNISSSSSISHDLHPFPFPNLEKNVGYDPIHHHHHHHHHQIHHHWSSSLVEPERDSEAVEVTMRHDACSSSPPPTASSSSPAAAASPGGKRGRDPEEEVYLDNLHSHKRYLSEMMASSLNGLTVGDSVGENLMESPLRSDATCNLRDENTSQYSPMLEDSDDARFCDTLSNTLVVQSDFISNTTSPLSPHRYQKPVNGVSSFNPYPLPGCTLAAVVCSHARNRGSDSEGRFPSSPNDVCHTADLRRAALLRSVQMRAQPYYPLSYEAPFHSVPDNMHNVEEEEDQTCSFIKSLDDETVYQSPEHISDYAEVCSSVENLGKGKLGKG